MGRTPRSEAEINSIRTRLLDAAITLFFEQGYNSTSVSEVANAAGYSTPTLYKYFENKDALVEGILVRLFEAHGDMLDFPVPKGLSTQQLIELLLSQMSRWAKQHHQELMFISNNLPSVCPELSNGVNPHLEIIKDISGWIQRYTSKRQRGGLTAETLARTIMALVKFGFEMALEAGDVEAAFEQHDIILEILFTKLEN